jgi:hypothetical protein
MNLTEAETQGDRYRLPCRQSSINAPALRLCRQLHHETCLMPLQINVVDCPEIMRSNTTDTQRLIEELRPFQRRAIRRLRLRLLASVTEVWSLRVILRLIADSSTSSCAIEAAEAPGDFDCCSDSDLRELSIFVTTRDLVLAHADSLGGLRHFISTTPDPGPSPEAANGPITIEFLAPCPPSACTASWATAGLAHLRNLRTLRIVIETSTSVSNQLSSEERRDFAEFIAAILYWVDIDVQWKVQGQSIMLLDDTDEWDVLLQGGDELFSQPGAGIGVIEAGGL